MSEGHEQAHSADILIEPHVQPDVDSYLRDKLAQVTALKTRLDASRAYRGKFDNSYPVGQGRVMLDEYEAALLERTTPEAEIQRLQGVWRAAAIGDFAAVSTEV